MEQATQQALSYLEKEPILHIDMIEAIRRGTGRIEEVSGQGVLIKIKDAPIHLISSTDEEELLCWAKKVEEDGFLLVLHQQDYAKTLQQKTKFVPEVICRHAAYTKKEEVCLPDGQFTIRPLTLAFLGQVAEHYSMGPGEGYLQERIEKGNMIGAFYQDTLAGFAGVHDEGSIGLVQVLPQFQRKGVGYLLEGYLTNVFVRKGYTPFVQVKLGNEISVGLQTKLGYEFDERSILWFEKKV